MFRCLIIVALVVLASPSRGLAETHDLAELDRLAMASYVNLEVDEAEGILRRAIATAAERHERGPVVAHLHTSLGVVLAGGRGSTEAGRAEFERAFRDDPGAELDPATSTPELARLFEAARANVRANPLPTDAGTSTNASSSVAGPVATGDVPASSDGPYDERAGRPSTGRKSRLHAHGLGIGYHAVFAGTENGNRYRFQGYSVVYDYFVGKKWGFMLRGEAWFPIYGRLRGDFTDYANFLFHDYPERRYGFDGLLMAARRIDPSPRVAITLAAGAHVHSMVLRSVDYRPIEMITVGLGFVGKLELKLSSVFSLQGQIAASVDFFDTLTHQNSVSFLVPVTASFGVGVRY